MRVIWMPNAKTAVRETAKYIRKEFGKRDRDKFMRDVREASRLIGKSPGVGKEEPLLADRAIMYRSFIVNHLNKIIYWVATDHIEVADFWDVRREPNTLTAQVK